MEQIVGRKQKRVPSELTSNTLEMLFTPGAIARGVCSLMTSTLVLADDDDDKDKKEISRDTTVPEEGQIEFGDLFSWATDIAAALLACKEFTEWGIEVIRRVLQLQFTPPGKARDDLESALREHVKSVQKLMKITTKTQKDVDDPYNAGDYDRVDCFAFEICGKEAASLCVWQDDGAVVTEIMITVIDAECREKVIFWVD